MKKITQEWLDKWKDVPEPEGCPGCCGAIAGCCNQYPECPGNPEWKRPAFIPECAVCGEPGCPDHM